MRAQIAGLSVAMATRILLLFALTVGDGALGAALRGRAAAAISGRDLILFGGGLFLLWKSVHEIHGSLEGEESGDARAADDAALWLVLAQIAVLDVVFSLDSVITAVGLVDELPVMVARDRDRGAGDDGRRAARSAPSSTATRR